MNESQRDPAYRAIWIVALIQAGVVVGGTLFVAAMLKVYGYNDHVVPGNSFRPEALFIRHSGFLLLWLPVIWAVVAVFTAQATGHPWLPLAVLLLGIAAALYGIYRYTVLGFNAAIF